MFIGLMDRVFTNGPGDRGSIPVWVMPKTKKKMVLGAALLSIQHYKVRTKGKMEKSREWSSAFSVVAIEKGAFRLPLTKVANLLIRMLQFYFLSVCVCVCVCVYERERDLVFLNRGRSFCSGHFKSSLQAEKVWTFLLYIIWNGRENSGFWSWNNP